MILLQINIQNPWGNDFKNIRCWTGKTPLKHKFWEFELLKSTDILNIHFEITHRRNHAGLNIELALFGYGLHFMIYDSRHWINGNWEMYLDEG